MTATGPLSTAKNDDWRVSENVLPWELRESVATPTLSQSENADLSYWGVVVAVAVVFAAFGLVVMF